MIPLLLISHGPLAGAAVASMEMILGVKPDQVSVILVTEELSYDDCLQQLQQKYEDLYPQTGLVIITDIYGGTPANIASYLALKHKDVLVFSGLSLPILLEYVLQKPKSMKEARKIIIGAGKKAVIDISQKLEEATYGDSINPD